MTSKSNKLRLASGALLLSASLVTLAGCAQHGKYTSKGLENANLRVAQMKAATQWDMARQQFLSGDLRKAQRSIESSIALNDQVVKSHVLFGRILIERGELEKALEVLQAALDVDQPDVESVEIADANYYRGIVFERFSQPQHALEAYRAASEADSTNPQFVLAAAEMLVELGEIDEAKAQLTGEVNHFEHNAGIRQMLGHIAMMDDDYESARHYFEQATLLGAGDLSLREDLVRAQVALGQFADAEANLAWILEDPAFQERDDLFHLRAKCLLELNRPVEAREILSRLTSKRDNANNVDAWIDLGNSAIVLSDQPTLRRVGQRLMSIAPDRAEGFLLFAMWERSRSELEDAVAVLYRGMKNNSSDARLPVVQGLIYQEMGNTELARRSFKMAINRDSTNVQAQQLLAAMRGKVLPNAVAEVSEDDQ